jgi:hypothetical protein
MFPTKDFNFSYSGWKNLYWKFICLIKIWITWSQKKLAKPYPKFQLYTSEKEITKSRGNLSSSNLEYEFLVQ